MSLLPPDSRRVITPDNPLFNQFPLTAVTAIDSQLSNNQLSNNFVRASGIVISPNHVLSAGHVGYRVSVNQPVFAQRATTSNNEISLNSFILGTSGDPSPNIINSYYPANFPATDPEKPRDDIVLFKTSNTLLPASQVAGLIAFVNLRSAMGLTIKTAGYPNDNVSSNILNNSGQPRRDLVLSPGDKSTGTIVDITDRRRFFYSSNVDTADGQSGSGVWHSLDGDLPRVLGVHSSGPNPNPNPPDLPTYLNSGVLITKDIYDLIINRIEEDFPGTANADLLPENAIIGTDPFLSLDGNDEIVDTYRRERILGNGGNDKIEGGGADDRLDGGEGERDIAIFSDDFENYDYSISQDKKTITFNHTRGTKADDKDTLKNIEFAKFFDTETSLAGIASLLLEDGEKDTLTGTNIFSGTNPNDPNKFGFLSQTLPISMLDGNAEYTVNFSAIPADTQYNIAFIIDTSASMDTTELQQAKDAYISLANNFINTGIADVSNFAVISFSEQAFLNANLTAEQAISTIQNLTTINNTRTRYNNALIKGLDFFTQSPLKGVTNLAFFTSDGSSQTNYFTNEPTYHQDAMNLRSVANVQAFGIYDSSDPGTISQSQVDFVDSDNAVILNNASQLETALGKSGLISYLDRIELLKEDDVVQTIEPNQLTDSPLGLSFTGTINNLNVSLNAQNQITAKAYFTNGTAPANLDFTVASGLEESTSDPLTDIIAGTPGDDVLYLSSIDLGANGDTGNDKIVGNKYENDLNGGDGNDRIFAHEGNDTIITGNGLDRVDGGTGVDTAVYADKLFAASVLRPVGQAINVDNVDTLTNVEFLQYSDFRVSTKTLQVTPILQGNDVTVAEGESDTIAQFTLNLSTPAPVDVQFDYNTVDGDAVAGEDYLAKSGTVNIAAGDTSANVEVEVMADTIDESTETFSLNLSNISGATFANNEVEYSVIAQIENKPQNLTLIGDNNPNTLVGGNGNDTLSGNGGDDLLFGEAGNDTLAGGSGNDALIGSSGNDTLNGNIGIDTLIGGEGDDNYIIDNLSDSISEETDAGYDVVQTFVSWTLGSNLEKLLLKGDLTIDGTGNTLDNLITGNTANNNLTGGAGNDTLNGSTGNDTTIGGTGNDTYIVDSSEDVITETVDAGTDTVNSSLTYTLKSNLENLTLIGSSIIDATGNSLDNIITGNNTNNLLSGGNGNDTLIGNSGSDRLTGNSGDDSMVGGVGNDIYLVNSLGDTISENADEGTDLVNSSLSYTLGDNLENLTLTGNDVIDGTGNSLNNDLTGNSSNNILVGSAGNDTLSGNDGDDLIIGEAGSDRLTGGNGIDRFRFLSLNERTDRIVDFVVADDIIEVSASFGGGLIAGSTISSNQFVIGSSALAPSDRFIYDSSNGALWFDRDGTGSASQYKLATLSSGLSLTFEDIVVI